jgi:lipoprotein-anchoring transpeptidase ErfK/SrfK
VLGLSGVGGSARADVFIAVNKSTQRMSVMVDGRERYRWPVSTGVGGGPPSGAYSPDRMERKWYSRRYNGSPMPHAIFFHKGYAIHGTYYVSRLGRPASHGCVRLHPSHAARLFALVRQEGMRRTRIVVSSSSRYAAR